METLAAQMAQDGVLAHFVLLSDANASDFVDRTSVPLFEDNGSGQPAWDDMEENAVKHDTFVFAPNGERILFWDASANSLSAWKTDIRAAVETQ